MKTAISLPDEVFEAAERAAKDLGVSRSELYASAVRDYVERIQREGVTARLNAVYRSGGEDSTLDPIIDAMQFNSVKDEVWD
ncbi:MAG: ribbon-helix-helix protein, CopG family [Gammaproteobacteria bacterium]|nr:ribbon-helix-helix protein, CopG family [Gammaproteobacteria bacterium]